MENMELAVCLLLSLWCLLQRERAARQARLRAARRNTEEKYRRLYMAINEYHSEVNRIRRRRRMRMALLSQSYRSRPSAWCFNRASEWWESIVPSFSATEWLENFRMSEETFTFICNKVQPAMKKQDTSFRHCVPVKKRVAMALWKLATGSEYRTIAILFGVSRTTVCRCVQEFCAAAEKFLVPELIRIPDERTFQEMAACIESSWGLPQCVGAIDGLHIPIIAPQHHHTNCFNRKGCHSIVLQGVVDGRGQFWNVFTGLPGNSHDESVLRLSTMWELASRGNLFPAHTKNIGTVPAGYYILGDSAYPLQEWLMKPFNDTGRLTAQQHTFNTEVSLARVVVEMAFGKLKGRWRCLLKRNDCDITMLKSMVLVCCALHNLCEGHGDSYVDTWDAPESTTPEPMVSLTEEECGSNIRDALMQYLVPNI